MNARRVRSTTKCHIKYIHAYRRIVRVCDVCECESACTEREWKCKCVCVHASELRVQRDIVALGCLTACQPASQPAWLMCATRCSFNCTKYRIARSVSLYVHCTSVRIDSGRVCACNFGVCECVSVCVWRRRLFLYISSAPVPKINIFLFFFYS